MTIMDIVTIRERKEFEGIHVKLRSELQDKESESWDWLPRRERALKRPWRGWWGEIVILIIVAKNRSVLNDWKILIYF